ncbi:MAG: HD family hydrolase [Pseudomonadota bacterium]
MLSGRRLDLLDPSPLDVEIEDIAHGLARVARWNGQTKGPHAYSVAQHSLLVEAIFARAHPGAGAGDCLAALLHDAPEYVVGDLISPFKSAIGGAYRTVEARLERAIALRFSLPDDARGRRKALIKAADRVAAHHEATHLAGFSPAEAAAIFGVCPPADVALGPLLAPWSTEAAKARFLTRFNALDQAAAA